MKKQILLFVAFVCLTVSAAQAQIEAKQIAVGVHGGFSKLLGKDIGGGGLNWILDAKYYLTEQLAVGAEYSSNGFLGIDKSATSGTGFGDDLGVYGGKQFLVKGEYYFTNKKVRPYAGLGLGYSGVTTPELTVNGAVAAEKTSRANFGISPRLGLMLGKFGLEFQYNLAGKTPTLTSTSLGAASLSNKAFNYWTINIGYVYPFSL